jgi:hypothetical protein
VIAAALPLRADAQVDDDEEFFEKRIRPVLVERCGECHAGDEPESGLNLDSRLGILKGGMRGPAVDLDRPDQSLLLLAINHADQLHMPPKSKIPQREIDDLTRWIRTGMFWPGQRPADLPIAPPSADERPLTEADRSFWSFRPVERPPLPSVRDRSWLNSPVDAFILARLEEAGLSPAPPADRRTLIRRATFDLWGLPPSPADVEAFLADDSPDAFERLLDRLLASPRYGERWGRHWLDVARYADSNGLDENLAYANAWRYRDWVIDAQNADLPYGDFIREQLAGDLLDPAAPPADRLRRLTATGFLALGAKMLAEDDPIKLEMDVIDEQVDTLGQAFLGLTLGCARCHDHMFDPISMADYYGLAGIFKSTRTMETLTVVARWHERPLAPDDQVAARDEIQRQIGEIQTRIDCLVSEQTEQLLAQARTHLALYLLAAARVQRMEQWKETARPWAEQEAGLHLPGLVRIEAESFPRGNVLRETENYGRGIGVLVNQGPTPNFVEYDVEIASTGLFQLDLRYAAAESRPCTLSIDGRPIHSGVAAGITGGWAPDAQSWSVEAVVPLTAGRHVLRLEQPHCFPHIDQIVLAPLAETVELADLDMPRDSASGPDYEPVGAIVSRWQAHLAESPEETRDLWRPWRHLIDRRSWDGWTEEPGQSYGVLLAEPRPESPRELAMRYERLLAEAEPGSDPPSEGATPGLAVRLKELVHKSDGPFSLKGNEESALPEAIARDLAFLRDEKSALEGRLPDFPHAMAVAEGSPGDLRIHIRGNHLSQSALVPRRFPRVLAGDQQPAIPFGASGRRELAEWIAGPDHPLVPRVLVNRVWQHHFGEGIVASADNFGRLGEPPTHPELLDWLAAEFRDSGGSLKHLHRLMLSSSAWRQSTIASPQGSRIDPTNRLLWRARRRRLEAEALRDSLLVVSGRLDPAMRGSLLPTANREYVTSTANVNPAIYDSRRRTVYLPVVRSAVYDFLQAFDFGDPSVMQGKRDRTTVAPQALFLMNSDLVAEASQSLVETALAERTTIDERLDWLFETVFSRPITSAHADDCRTFLDSYGLGLAESGTDAGEIELRSWQALCRALFLTHDFLWID